MGSVSVVEVGRDRLPEVVELPFRLHGHDPLWIPPLRLVVLRELAQEDAFARHGRTRTLAAERGGRLVGRITAITDEKQRDHEGHVLGQLGHYEAEDDPDVARALIEAGLEVLRASGARQVLGPMNGGAHRLHRFMVRGFDRDPFLFEPRNPACYPEHWRALGFEPVHTWHSYDLEAALLPMFRQFLSDGVERARGPSGLHIELLEPRDVMGTLGRLLPLLDRVWSGHIGYATLDLPELAEAFAGVLELMTSRHIGCVRNPAQDLGVAFMYPDYAGAARALQGDATRWSELRAGPRPDRMILHTVALAAEARRTGASAALVDQGLAHTIEDDYARFLVGMVSTDFSLIGKALEATREYQLFGRAVG